MKGMSILTLLLCLAFCCLTQAGLEKPNIIFILADDLGYGDIGCYNPQSKIPTPNLDRLAQQGIRFTDAHTPSTVCTPTRYSVLTGRYPWRSWKTSGVLMGFSAPLIGRDTPTVGQVLRQSGYRTVAVGKWHLGMTWTMKDGTTVKPPDMGPRDGSLIDFTVPIKDAPTTRGFDYFFGTSACPTTDWLYAFIENDGTVGLPTERWPGTPKEIQDKYDFCTSRPGVKVPDFDFETVDKVLLNKSIKFMENHIKKNPDQPFFLYHATQTPHLPAWPAKQFVGKSQAGNLGDFIHEFDWVAGRIIETVDRLGIANDTLIIVTSDNGPEICTWQIKQRYQHDASGGLRGMKRDNWEGGHRVPFISRWPGKIRPGSVSDELICLVDFMATAAAVAGAGLPENAAVDSYNILPALLEKNDKPIREALVHHTITGALGIRKGRWKLLLHKGAGNENYRANGWMGTIPIEPPLDNPDASGQLYDMIDDPGETKNLYYQHPEIVANLTALLQQYQRDERSAPRR